MEVREQSALIQEIFWASSLSVSIFQKNNIIIHADSLGGVRLMWGSLSARGCSHMFGRRLVWGSWYTEGSSGSCGQMWFVLPQGCIRKLVIKPKRTSVCESYLIYRSTSVCLYICVYVSYYNIFGYLIWSTICTSLTPRCLCKSSGTLWTGGSGSGLQWILHYMTLCTGEKQGT